MNISIIGTGRMGRALSTRLLGAGFEISLVGHTPEKAEALADELKQGMQEAAIAPARPGSLPGELVFLAVPYSAVTSILKTYRSALPGKVLVDLTNPIDLSTFAPLDVAGSGAEEIRTQVPSDTPVVKAFNIAFAGTVMAGKVAGQTVDVLVAGDDAAAKDRVLRLVERAGLHPIDAGGLARARQLEALGYLHVVLQQSQKTNFMSTFKLLS